MNMYNKHKKRFEKWGLILIAVAVSVMVFNIRESSKRHRKPAMVEVHRGVGK